MTQIKPFALSAVLATAALFTACGATPAAGPVIADQTSAQSGSATTAAPQAGAFTGTIAETMNSGGYTYMRLQAAGTDDVWVAASEMPVKTGERITVALDMPMQDFHSVTLKRDFPLIYFVAGVAREGETLTAGNRATAPAPMGSHQPTAAAAPVEPIAPAPGGMSVADVWAQRKSLAGKPVVVRGKVVKVNNGIMGSNWIHLQDGSGSAADATNDLTVTTDAEVKIGDVVTASGVLAVEKDFGAGYAYAAILEKATIAAK